jgi:phosphatidylglycerophosphatase A
MPLDAGQRRRILAHPAGWIATGFGIGLSPIAPGTLGSLAALVPWLWLRELPPLGYALALALGFALGVWAGGWCVQRLGAEDPGAVVWDECVGQWLALTPLLGARNADLWIFAGFILFRVFDIAKPWPVVWADRRIRGGLGVMLDDVLAGGYAALALVLTRWWFA